MDITDAAPQGEAGAAGEQPTASVSGTDRPGSARRRILATGVGGAAASLLPFLTQRASARPLTTPDTDGTDGSDTASTTTTAPPPTTAPPVKRPTTEDVALLGFAQSVELSIRDLYDVALQGQVFDADTAPTITAVREAHEAYAQSISGLIARLAPNTRDEALFTSLEADFGGSAAAVAAVAAGVENQAVATHLDLLGRLVGIDGAALIASILTVEARQATVLNDLAGATDLAGLLAGDAEPFAAGQGAG